MRKTKLVSVAAALLIPLAGCEGLLGPVDGTPSDGTGTLLWSFSPDEETVCDELTRATGVEVPDTNQFILTVTNSSGKVLYTGRYGNAPMSLLVEPGSYTVSVKSSEFSLPAFSAPQFGDEQVVVVKKGENTRAVLHCSQINAGIRLKVSPSFLTDYPSATLFVKSSEGKLLYSYSEKRVAYFVPGPVSVVKSEGARDELLFTRNIAPQQVLTVSITTSGAAGAGSGGFSIQVDTARVWTDMQYNIGGGSTGTSPSTAYSCSEVADHAGEEGVWVYGYIVGGDLSSSGSRINLTAPFSSDTHLAIAPRTSVTEKASCVSVELKKGALRDALNLVDNPYLLGCQVFLKGNLVAGYYGIPGVKNITEWELR